MAASKKVNAAVRRSGVVVDSAPDRPVRTMPDGTSGIVWASVVYPLHAGAGQPYIELSDVPVDKGRCPSFVAVDQPLTFAEAARAGAATAIEVDRWNIESNKFGHYLVFDGSEELAEDVVTRLEDAEIGVRRWDVSHRPAADGYFYDWFARLEFDGPADRCRLEVAAALGGRPPAEADAISEGEHSATAARVVELERRVDELRRMSETVLAQVVSQRDAALQALADSETEALEAREEARRADRRAVRAAREAAAQRDAVEQLRVELAFATESGGEASAEMTAVLGQLYNVRADRDATLTELVRLEGVVADAEELAQQEADQSATLRERIAELEGKLQNAHEQRVVAETAPPRRAAALRDNPLRRRVWRRLVLDDDAIAAINDREQFAELSDLFQVLFALDSGSVGFSRWENGICEVDHHIRTGLAGRAGDMGRVYYATQPDDRVRVFAHRKVDKKQQERFVQRIGQRAARVVD